MFFFPKQAHISNWFQWEQTGISGNPDNGAAFFWRGCLIMITRETSVNWDGRELHFYFWKEKKTETCFRYKNVRLRPTYDTTEFMLVIRFPKIRWNAIYQSIFLNIVLNISILTYSDNRFNHVLFLSLILLKIPQVQSR